MKTTGNSQRSISLKTFLSRLIWLCVLPLLVLAAWLVSDSVRTSHTQSDQELANLAKNFAKAIDQHLDTRIRGLNMLAVSPLVDDAAQWENLYQEAQGFLKSFGSHVVLADIGKPMHMLFNTRVPFGTQLPPLPQPQGHAAAPAALATLKPAVSDAFIGPIIKEVLVAIAIPVLREGKATHLILTIFEPRQFQALLDQFALPEGCSLTLRDGLGAVLAHRGPQGFTPGQNGDGGSRSVVQSAVSSWNVATEIPKDVHRMLLLKPSIALILGLVIATMISLLAGMAASGRLARAVASLTQPTERVKQSPDITEISTARSMLNKALTGLRESEERFRTLANAIPQLCWMADAEGWIFWYNQRWYEYTGTTPEQMEGWGWQNVHDPEELPKVLERWQLSIATGESFDMTFPLRGVDGVFHPFLTRVIPVKDEAGRVQRWFGTNTDISELKRIEEALRESEAMYRSIGESIDYGVWTCDPAGRNTYASESFLKMVGMTQEQCRDSGWGEVLHPDDAEHTLAAWQECVRTGSNWDAEHRFRGTDGGWHPVLARGVPIRNEQGKIIRWAGINLDISLLKKAQEQLKASLAEKEVMLREIHHRVKNNLQIISSLVSLQADTLTDERTRAELNDVCNRVRTMAMIHEKLYRTDDLAQLNFADYAAGLLHYLWRSHDVLAEKVQLHLALAPVMLSIEKAVPCGLILNELAGNALKHAFPRDRHGEVTVGLEHDSATDTTCLWVRDTGIGLPSDQDWRQSNSLGLRLVQILTGQLGGTVETGNNQGTEFRVTFPLNRLPS